jgi:hypothetical protein
MLPQRAINAHAFLSPEQKNKRRDEANMVLAI